MDLKLLYILLLLSASYAFSQQNIWIEGFIFSEETNKPVEGAILKLIGTDSKTTSQKDGSFKLTAINIEGECYIQIEATLYSIIKIPISIEKGKNLSLQNIFLKTNIKNAEAYFTAIDINSLNIENNESDQQQLLQATKDPILKSTAFHWSSTFFKLRGLGNENQKVLMNGISMNKLQNLRPNWSNWTGLNDIIRNQETSNYSSKSTLTFGGLNGSTNFKINALSFKKGTKVSLASTNRSFQKRFMLTHHTGLLPSNWAFSFSTSFSHSTEGYIKGTNLKTFSAFGSIERKLHANHNLSLNLVYTPTQRGKTSPNTQEVIDIKGSRYNAYWGFQNEKIRNSRVKKVTEPFAVLTHFWKPTERLYIHNNLLFQYGFIKNSRLDHTGTTAIPINNTIFFEGIGTNTDPTYYQKLPSYFLRNTGNEDYQNAFLADRFFRENGQIDWSNLYEANTTTNNNATYILFNDVVNDFLIAANSIWNYTCSEKTSFQGALHFKNLISKNYAEVEDLLGGTGYLDVDAYSEHPEAQNNLQNSNRIVVKGDDFRYNYQLNAKEANGFLQVNSTIGKLQYNTAISVIFKSYQRNGKYENGYFPSNLSFGKSSKINLLGYGIKFNLDYSINPKWYLSSNIFFNENPLNTNQAFINSRQTNTINPNPNNEKQFASDINVNYRFNAVSARLSVFYNQFKDGTKNSFFYSEDIAGLGRTENSGFFQENISNINRQFIGLEFGIETQITNTIALLFATSIGNYRHTNNPNLLLFANNSSEAIYSGETLLKNYHLANGPQQVFGAGFSYRDPKYWWFSTQLNYFKKAFINVSPLLRTSNFATDIDGFPILNYNPEVAKELLQQEEFNPYFLWNAIGGKSWKVKKKYIGFTLGIQNILNQVYKTGGFEQSRNSNYTSLNEDQNRQQPLFGSKYWHGTGSTYYINTYLRY